MIPTRRGCDSTAPEIGVVCDLAAFDQVLTHHQVQGASTHVVSRLRTDHLDRDVSRNGVEQSGAHRASTDVELAYRQARDHACRGVEVHVFDVDALFGEVAAFESNDLSSLDQGANPADVYGHWRIEARRR